MNTSPGIFPIGTVLNGLYEVLHLIENDNNEARYAALDITRQKPVVLKVLQPYLADYALALMHQNDARNLSVITHPNILRVYAYLIAESGDPYIVCEHFEGRELAALIAQNNGLSYKLAMQIFVQICLAMEAAHKIGVIVRELNPSCVFILRNDSDHNFVKLFNLASALRQGSPHGVLPLYPIAGDACYQSPELLGGAAPDARSDIFSIGCLMFETLMGQAPFTVREIRTAVAERTFINPPRFAVIRPELRMPEFLEKIIRCALERDPQDRFASVSALRTALLLEPAKQSIADLDSRLEEIKAESLFLKGIEPASRNDG